eukprot:Blabericola_migrator_1__1047@NODE_1266_length_4939_cov_239_532635_g855_i0_p3_GENE_NODE_1266_length_4939_cov_239_532635_g855_i0NODE_1266_length_4939_cov_239_532635_g855_i0_p3_ORF_typecomplete_len375_score45_81_NODE_1266_length_4939_cov_239_532635_g855_i034484572
MRPFYISPTPGFCTSQEGTGVLLRCPPGLMLETTPVVPPKFARKGHLLDPDRKDTQKLLRLMRRQQAEAAESQVEPQPEVVDFRWLKGAPAKTSDLGGFEADEDWPEDLDAEYVDELENPSTVLVDGEHVLTAVPRRRLWTGEPRLPEIDIEDFDDDAFITPSEYRCVGVDQRIYSPEQWKQRNGRCPDGYSVKQSIKTNTTLSEGADTVQVICEGFPSTPAEPFCPPTFSPALLDYQPAAFFELKALHCAGQTRYKGRMWCPDSMELVREPFPDLPFGSEIAPDFPDDPYDPYVYSRWGFLQAEGPICARTLSVHHSKCDRWACSSDEVKQLAKIIRHFGYHRLDRDPAYVLFDSIPTGKDLWYTPKGKGFPF